MQRKSPDCSPGFHEYQGCGWQGISELHRHGLDLFGGKDRTVLADVDIAHVAAAALAQAALHPVLQRGVDLIVGEAELLQHRQGELDHDRRAADKGDGVFGTGGGFFQDGRHEADPAVPLGAVAPRIHGLHEAHIGTFLPRLQAARVDQGGLGAGRWARAQMAAIKETAAAIEQAATWDARIGLVRRIPEAFGTAQHKAVYGAVARRVYVPNLAPDFAYVHWTNKFDLDALRPLADEFCPTRAEISQPFAWADVPEEAKECPGLHAENQLELV